ncbi:MAG: hypothetical protein WBE92_04130 [Steroidobacteraceae bacterium]
MTSRREFLQTAAVSAVPVVAGAAGIVDAVRPRAPAHTAVHAVLIDERHAEARSFGTRLSGDGVTVYATPDGDVTQVWLRRIGPAWRRRPVAIAGLTERPALFCLEQFALSCGLRVVFHGEHFVHPGGPIEHRQLRGARAAERFEEDLTQAGPRWPVRIADAVAAYREQAGRLRPGPSDAALEPILAPGAQLLTSWIIAAA